MHIKVAGLILRQLYHTQLSHYGSKPTHIDKLIHESEGHVGNFWRLARTGLAGLKELSNELSNTFTCLFKQSLATGKLPSFWKVYTQVLKGFNLCNIHNLNFDLIKIMWHMFVNCMR